MANEISSMGMKLKYAIGTASTIPTTFSSEIAGVKSIPEFKTEPETIEVTDLADKTRRYIPGLKSSGDAFGITLNHTDAVITAWNSMCSAAASMASASCMWFEYYIPNHSSFFFVGTPTELGFGGADVGDVMEVTGYITPNGEPKWDVAK